MPYSVVRFNCIQPGLEPERDGAALPGVRRDGGLRRRARSPGDLARGAPRRRERVEPVAAGHGGARVRAHARRSWRRSTRCSSPLHDPLRARRGHRGARPRQRRAASIVTGGIGYRRERVRGAREGLVGTRRAAGRSDRHDAQGVDRRAVRVPRDDGAGDAPSVHPAAPHAHARRVEQGGGAPCGALRAALPAARQPARARGLLLRAVRRSTAPRASAPCRRSTPR